MIIQSTQNDAIKLTTPKNQIVRADITAQLNSVRQEIIKSNERINTGEEKFSENNYYVV